MPNQAFRLVAAENCGTGRVQDPPQRDPIETPSTVSPSRRENY